MSIRAKVEAVLFLTDKPIHAAAIARIVNEDVQAVRQQLLELIHEYEERAGALEVAQDNGYMFQVKDEFNFIVEEFLPMEMPIALIRTLSAIAIKQPITQSEIVRVRGAGAYEHVRELLNRGLVSKREEGRSPILTTTKRFKEYFRLTKDARSTRRQMKKDDAAKAREQAAAQLGLPLPGSADEEGAAAFDTAQNYDEMLDQLLESALNAAAGEDDSETDGASAGSAATAATAGETDGVANTTAIEDSSVPAVAEGSGH